MFKNKTSNPWSKKHSSNSSNSCSPKEISANAHEPIPKILRILRAKEKTTRFATKRTRISRIHRIKNWLVYSCNSCNSCSKIRQVIRVPKGILHPSNPSNPCSNTNEYKCSKLTTNAKIFCQSKKSLYFCSGNYCIFILKYPPYGYKSR